MLMAHLINDLEALIYGLSDKKRRGKRPKPIGPSYLQQDNTKKLAAMPMSRAALMRELSKPRRGEK